MRGRKGELLEAPFAAGRGSGLVAGAGGTVNALATAYGPGGHIDFPLFPADNPWNTDISSYPVDPRSDRYIATIGLDTGLHPDFGTVWNGAPIGIPYVVVSGNQPIGPGWDLWAPGHPRSRIIS
jgi:hypothetical protein